MLSKYKNLVWGMSNKRDGSMKLSGNKFDREILKNQQKFFIKLGIDYNNVVFTDLQHGNNIKIVERKHAGQIISNTDGIITNEKKLFLTITMADCLPIYFYDHKKKIIGIAHAGWQGVKKNIVSRMVQVMIENFKSKYDDILVNVGAHIQKCHFEVNNDTAKKFKEYQDVIVQKRNKTFINLSRIAAVQLFDVGVPVDNVEVSQECTYCLDAKYFSYRRDKPKDLKAMIAYIGLRE